MPLLRLILVVGLAAGTLILARSNWQSMPVVFLGLRSLALPLTVWLLAAALAGVVTTLVIRGLLQLTGLAAQRTERQRFRSQPGSRSSAYQPPPSSSPRTWQPPPAASTRPPASDDWERDADDWFDDEPTDSRRGSSANSPRPEARSADYRSERAVDADYRVIVPPQRNLEDEP